MKTTIECWDWEFGGWKKCVEINCAYLTQQKINDIRDRAIVLACNCEKKMCASCMPTRTD